MVLLSNEPLWADIRSEAAGFRLQYLEVFNWGTFHRQVWSMTPRGGTALLTGANGSGKSTLIDALLTLLVPSQRRSYNLASGSEKARERDERSYVLGAWGKQKDAENHGSKAHYLRQPGTHSVLLASFANGSTNQTVTVAQVLWIEDTVRKLFVVAPLPLTIENHFRLQGSPTDLRKHLKECGAEVFSEFAVYSRRFRQLMGFRSEKALDLFNQIVSIKEIGGLNDFVREHMLEKTDIQTRIKQLRENFENLTRAHDAIQRAEHQLIILEPLMQEMQRYDEQQSRIEETNRSTELLQVYIASQRMLLAQHVIVQAKQRLIQEQASEEVQRIELAKLQDEQVNLRVALAQDDAGQQIELLRREIDNQKQRKDERQRQANRYSDLARHAGLEPYSDKETFYRMRQIAELRIAETEQDLKKWRSERDTIVQQDRKLKENGQDIERELSSLKKRTNQIPAEDIIIRRGLLDALDLKESDLPFVGELLRVRQSEQHWEPAIERLLRGFGRQLLVPESWYSQVSMYVNQTNLAGRLVYHRVHSTRTPRHDGYLEQNALFHKLEVRPETAFTGWLTAELIDGFNYLCCETLAEFQRANRALTQNGQVRHGQQRHEKDDRYPLGDRRRYVLGWSNQEKIKALELELQEVRKQQEQVQSQVKQIEARSDAAQTRMSVLQMLRAVENFEQIDWQMVALRLEESRRQLRELEEKSQHLDTLRKQLEKVSQDSQTLQETNSHTVGNIRDLRRQIKEAEEIITQCASSLENEILIREEATLGRIERDLRESQRREKELILTLQNIDEARERLRQLYHNRSQTFQANQRILGEKIVNGMRDFRQTNPVYEQEMDTRLEAIGEYRRAFEQVRHDDLPRHKRRFKDLLNEKVITDIGSFKAALDMQEGEIRRSIARLNGSLGSIGYTDSTFIQLVCERSRDTRLKEFRDLLRACLPDVGKARTAEDNETSFRSLRSLLKRFEDDARWTNLVTDVRNWLDFSAEELFRETGEQKNYYTDSSGKSGGQKVKLAYTILASAIAYQYGLDQESGREHTFRFVAVDEAFSKSDAQNARYAMELFRQLDLQVLVVTPLDKIHVAEPFISACHFVVNNVDENDSHVVTLSFADYLARKEVWQASENQEKEAHR